MHDLHKRYALLDACDSENQQQHLSWTKDIQNNEMSLFNWVTKREQICTNNRKEWIRKADFVLWCQKTFSFTFPCTFLSLESIVHKAECRCQKISIATFFPFILSAYILVFFSFFLYTILLPRWGPSPLLHPSSFILCKRKGD